MHIEDQRTRIKVCGLTTLEDARFTAGALADYLGFIFTGQSSRYVEPGQAAAIISWVEGPECIGVFADQPLDDVNSTAIKTGVDYVQLHGSETVDYCQLMEKPVIKAFGIEEGMTRDQVLSMIDPYLNHVDYVLFDTRTGGQSGGTGLTFDWQILSEVRETVPFFMAGGIGLDNLRQAIQTTNPYALDINSRVEEEPGIKDFDLLSDLFEEVREIWEEQETLG